MARVYRIIPTITPEEIERFWSCVNRKGPDDCWEWTGCRSPQGYGQFKFRQKTFPANRVAYLLSTGEQPDQLSVCHHCDNPPCCNPAHFFLGTTADNNADSRRKMRHCRGDRHWTHAQPEKLSARIPFATTHPDRMPRGEAHGMSKLTAAKVREMRRRYAEGATQVQLAADFRTRQTNVSQIVNHKTWRHA